MFYTMFMKSIEGINIKETIESTRKQLSLDPNISPSLKSAIELLLIIVKLLSDSLCLNSNNSSIPPSQDIKGKKALSKSSSISGAKKPGGQNGHKGETLRQVENPDEIEFLKIKREELPEGRKYKPVGVEKRQVVDLVIKRHVLEYQAEILEDESGKKYVASFPEGIVSPIQYGEGVRTHAVYMSQYQLIPYNRVKEQLSELLGLSISSGSIFNFNQEAYNKLESFEVLVKHRSSR